MIELKGIPGGHNVLVKEDSVIGAKPYTGVSDVGEGYYGLELYLDRGGVIKVADTEENRKLLEVEEEEA